MIHIDSINQIAALPIAFIVPFFASFVPLSQSADTVHRKRFRHPRFFTCVFDVRVLLHNFSGVLYIDLLHGGNASETGDLRVDLLKCAGCLKLTHPGVLVFARHIVVGVIARDDHERS